MTHANPPVESGGQGSSQPSPAVVQLLDVSKSFGGIRALSGVSFAVQPAEVVALAGENGAGKSTIKNLVTGLLAPSAGTVTLVDGSSPRSPLHSRSLGVIAVHQEFSLFPDLTVTENVFLFNRRGRGPRFASGGEARAACEELLTEIGAHFGPDDQVADLSPAEQQLVEVSKAVAQDPRLLILDEPTASLNISEQEQVHAVVRRLVQRGVGIVYISHHLEEILQLSDRTVVLRDGALVADVPTSELTRPELERLMVGRFVEEISAPNPPHSEVEMDQPPVLEVRGITDGEGYSPVDFSIQAGAVFGLAGLIGSGRTEIADSIFGLRDGGGRVVVDGRAVENRDPRNCKARGISFVTEDRRNEGLFLDRSIAENVSVTLLQKVSLGPLRSLTNTSMIAFGRDVVDGLGVRGAHNLRKPARSLSGGNQQKLVVGKWLATKPRVFILDEPTRGIDVGAKAEVHDLVRELAEAGNAVLLISSDLPEVLGISHRIGVMHQGRLTAVLDRDQADPTRVIRLATGGE